MSKIITVYKEEADEPVEFPPIEPVPQIRCKKCGRIISVTELYVVDGWSSRPDGLNFLGAIPKNIYCLPCGSSEEIRKLTKKEKEKKS
jgi:hypothetical protein